MLADIPNAVSYPNPILPATALVRPEIRDDPAVYPPADIRRRLYVDLPAPPEIAKRIAPEHGLPIVEAILSRDLDGKDPFIPLLLWWAVEHHAIPARDQIISALAIPTAWKSGITRETILPRMMRRYAAEGTDQGFKACANLLVSAPDEKATKALLAALDQGLPGAKCQRRTKARQP